MLQFSLSVRALMEKELFITNNYLSKLLNRLLRSVCMPFILRLASGHLCKLLRAQRPIVISTG